MTDPLGNSEFYFPLLRLGKHCGDSRKTIFTVSLRTSHKVLNINTKTFIPEGKTAFYTSQLKYVS